LPLSVYQFEINNLKLFQLSALFLAAFVL